MGFKSFADKTVIEFSPGITAVVGPNGCGKSNIADAFRWVLGEQSAKSMRGNKMYDIIFAGTSNRSAVNIAEVTLTLTDIAGALPTEYEELSVTRRLHRSGESQYFINGHLVRLKDVQSLFLDSGIGKNAFAIFEQGKIDQVIQYSPLERRYIFEEAAGILRFLQRKREALHKLDLVDNNIVRAKDIHQEVEKQIIVLEQQAAQARVYKENKATFEILEKALCVSKCENLQRRGTDFSKKEETQQELLATKKQELEKLQVNLQEAKNELSISEKALRTKSEDLYRTRNDKELKTRERDSQQERLKESLIKEKRWQQELSGLLEKRQQRQTERNSAQGQQQTFEQGLIEHTGHLQSQRDKTKILEETVSTLREQQQINQQERLKRLQAENQLESETKQNTVRRDSLLERQAALIDKNSKMTGRIKETSDVLEEKKQTLKTDTAAVDELKVNLVKLEQQYQKATTDIQTARNELNTVQQEVTEAKARQKVLIRLRDDKEGFSSGSKRLLLESSNTKSPLHNILKGLYELLNPHAGAEAALATTLRPYAQTLVVETKAQFEAVLSFAKQNQLKDFSLLCLEDLKGSIKQPKKAISNGIISILEKMAEHPLAYHLLQDVYLADDWAIAEGWVNKHPGSVAWTNEGYFIDSRRVLFYSTQGENNVFMREAELKTLQKKLETLEELRQKNEDILKACQVQQEKIHLEKSTLDKNIRRDEMTLIEVNFGVQRLQNDLEKARHEEKQIVNELHQVEATLETITSKIAQLTELHAVAKIKNDETNKLCSAIQADLEKQAAALKREREVLQDRESHYRKISDENKKVHHMLHILEVKDLESFEQEKRLNEELKFAKEFQSQVQQKGSEFEKLIKDVEKILAEVSKACADLEKDLFKRKQAIETIDEKIGNVRLKSAQLEEEIYRLASQRAQAQVGAQAIQDELKERFQLTLEEARELAIAALKRIESTEQIEKQIRKVRAEMEAAGDVNMMSIDEFDKHKDRYEFLNKQIDDLSGSKQELVQIIAELDGESRKIFKDTFDIIRANFQKNFQILFSGGEADLQFTEASDVLEAGIEIIAKPPGKQMRSIQLLSGGEKCLTAMALLFAIFEVKPAPFCILDEIDAPLDDSNVERFVNVVKQFNDRCQFMMITHNKRTMAIADVLCGVSMEERGVSKLISIEFSKKQEDKVLAKSPTLQFATLTE
jgi:chromosome segregation protein